MKISSPRHLAVLMPFWGLLLLCSCDRQDPQSGPGGLTPQDAQALDEAAAKLDSQTLPSAEPNAEDSEIR